MKANISEMLAADVVALKQGKRLALELIANDGASFIEYRPAGVVAVVGSPTPSQVYHTLDHDPKGCIACEVIEEEGIVSPKDLWGEDAENDDSQTDDDILSANEKEKGE